MTARLDPVSDKALMFKVRDGDIDRLGLLFERYHRQVYRYFYGMTLQRQTSEDLVQETFERILKYRHIYTGEGKFSTWIYQIARNLHSDYYRKNQRRPETETLIEPGMIQSEQDSTASASDSKDEIILLRRAIEKLDPVKRETLVLSRYEGLTYKTIANIMDCSVSAVKVRIFRALKELKEIISELKDEPL